MKLTKIFKDFRGEIFSLTENPLTVPEVSIMTCKAGLARGGCVHHKSKEHLCVIEGVIQYVYGEDKKHVMLHAGQSITIEPNTPHFFLSITDSIVSEWGPQLEEKQEKYEPFRKIVMEINNQ